MNMTEEGGRPSSRSSSLVRVFSNPGMGRVLGLDPVAMTNFFP